ncbi:MAG TPA: NAD-dependent epimerase/dehydratase family protein, partial [Candidatus Methanomethylicus sp.]|nr:NAD-dependent epimerase/dehydratase family protein [Candidatus Methanomethylicus sp.]
MSPTLSLGGDARVSKSIISKRGRRSSMRFLVTGGAGFIGSNIVRRLLADGDEVVVIDDLTLGNVNNVPGVKVLRGDVRDARIVDEACIGIDGIFHDAARSSAPMFSPDPREGVDVNLRGFMNVAEAARRLSVPVVYASTSSLYSRCEPPHREGMP